MSMLSVTHGLLQPSLRPLKPSTTLMATALALALVCGQAHASTQSQLTKLDTTIETLTTEVENRQAELQKMEAQLAELDAKIDQERSNQQKLSKQTRIQVHSLQQTARRNRITIQSLDQKIALKDNKIRLLKRDMERSHEIFEALNPLKKVINQPSHDEKLNSLQLTIAQLKAEHEELQMRQTELNSATAALDEELAILKNSNDQEINAWASTHQRVTDKYSAASEELEQTQAKLDTAEKQRSNLEKQLAAEENAQRRNRAKRRDALEKPRSRKLVATPVPKTKANDTPGKVYVFAVSGTQKPDIEAELKLKDWVESYGAEYIQARWDGTVNNKKQAASFEQAFASMLKSLEPNARILLIGHGLGGGVAIRAATEVAARRNRTIEFLAVLDPIGENNLRANIVYSNRDKCTSPDSLDPLANSDYLNCLKRSKKRVITQNVKHFYNRWQKESEGPADFQRKIRAITAEGFDAHYPTATGRFSTSNTTKADQKRVYVGTNDAHQGLLEQEADNLPNLLIKHLR